MSADVFENFPNMCLKIYEFDPAKFLSATELWWQVALKKTKVKLGILTDIDKLLILEKGIRGGICHSIYRHGKANHKSMKDYNRNKESLYLQYWNANNLYGWAVSQRLPVSYFELIKHKKYRKICFRTWCSINLEKKIHELHNDLRFLPERM